MYPPTGARCAMLCSMHTKQSLLKHSRRALHCALSMLLVQALRWTATLRKPYPALLTRVAEELKFAAARPNQYDLGNDVAEFICVMQFFAPQNSDWSGGNPFTDLYIVLTASPCASPRHVSLPHAGNSTPRRHQMTFPTLISTIERNRTTGNREDPEISLHSVQKKTLPTHNASTAP